MVGTSAPFIRFTRLRGIYAAGALVFRQQSKSGCPLRRGSPPTALRGFATATATPAARLNVTIRHGLRFKQSGHILSAIADRFPDF